MTTDENKTVEPAKNRGYAPADGSVNWTSDDWFAKHHASNVSDEFKAWWIEFYGTPDNYEKEEGEQHEYWIRCAFAWFGWRGHSSPNKERTFGKECPDGDYPQAILRLIDRRDQLLVAAKKAVAIGIKNINANIILKDAIANEKLTDCEPEAPRRNSKTTL